MSKHTPGPWFIGDANIPSDYTRGIQAGDFIVADLCDDAHTPETRRANARLIAAAPDMLEVLKQLAESAEYWSEYDVPVGIVDKINAAIAKAEGKQ